MAVKLAPQARLQYVDTSGNPYSGAKLFFYAAGTTTKQSTYTTSVGDVANTNPVVLDSSGRTPYGVWLTSGINYKIVLAPANDTDPPTSPIFTEDVISGINDEATGTQWAVSGSTPTYVSATQFTVPGDKTSTFLVDRRIRVVVTAGTLYGYISVSAYTSLTTVTVVMDSGSLDSGLASVDVGILTNLSGAIPNTITRNTTAQTLTNKSLSDSTTYIIDEADATKKVQFQVSGVTTGTIRTLTVPDANGTIALTNNKLSAFAATTSAELAATISDETGTGLLVFATDPTFTLSDVATNNVSSTAHGWCPKHPNDVTKFLRGDGAYAAFSAISITKSARTSNTILATSDKGVFVDITSGTFTQTFTAAATLGDGWQLLLRNSGTGDITLDPNGAELIDGLASFIMYPGETRFIQCDGSALTSVVLSHFSKTFTATGSFVKPPGYAYFDVEMWKAGESGAKSSAGVPADSGNAGGYYPITVPASVLAASETITIGAGGAAVSAASTAANAGGDTSLGTIASTTDFSIQTFPANYQGGSAAGAGAYDGASAVFGGASGSGVTAGGTPGTPGTSRFAGDGGVGSSAGSGADGAAPGGSGGGTQTGAASGAGARGELRIRGIA